MVRLKKEMAVVTSINHLSSPATFSGSAGQPILNDNAIIIQNTNDIAFVVNQVLGEGITDAEARIAQDFTSTGGDNYEIPSA